MLDSSCGLNSGSLSSALSASSLKSRSSWKSAVPKAQAVLAISWQFAACTIGTICVAICRNRRAFRCLEVANAQAVVARQRNAKLCPCFKMWAAEAWNSGFTHQDADELMPSDAPNFAKAQSMVESSNGLKELMFATAELAIAWMSGRGASRIVARDQATLLSDCGCASPGCRAPNAAEMVSKSCSSTGCFSNLACTLWSREHSFAKR
mmetsp:Transcript_105238/g.145556  ORF Transcript_105238/g.145556 Transcript_105238/m.145556 type:complete len:208 (-) Transcript_105238:243-866(-)